VRRATPPQQSAGGPRPLAAAVCS